MNCGAIKADNTATINLSDGHALDVGHSRRVNFFVFNIVLVEPVHQGVAPWASSSCINFYHSLSILQLFGGIKLRIAIVINIVVSAFNDFVWGDSLFIDAVAFGCIPAGSGDLEKAVAW